VINKKYGATILYRTRVLYNFFPDMKDLREGIIANDEPVTLLGCLCLLLPHDFEARAIPPKSNYRDSQAHLIIAAQ
jgi:hypothetical protein